MIENKFFLIYKFFLILCLKTFFSEISRDTETTFKKLLTEASKAPAPKQIGIGAACGWVSGYVMMKVGKAAATAVGGSLILLQIAHYKG